jgi:hypothetical protein
LFPNTAERAFDGASHSSTGVLFSKNTLAIILAVNSNQKLKNFEPILGECKQLNTGRFASCTQSSPLLIPFGFYHQQYAAFPAILRMHQQVRGAPVSTYHKRQGILFLRVLQQT